MIITEALVQKAIRLAIPSARAILAAKETTWGPKWMECKVNAPGLEKPIYFRFGTKTPWLPRWGKRMNFKKVMEKKFDLAERTHQNTSVTVLLSPWLVQPGEYLYAGATHREGITAAASGARGWADEGLMDVLICYIIILARIETDIRIERKRKQI